MNNAKVKEIIKFSLYQNIQNKWFVIFNILTLVGIITIVNWGNVASLFKQDEQNVFQVVVLDNQNLIYNEFANGLSGDNRYQISKIDVNNYTSENISDKFMIIEISGDEEEVFKTSIISKEGIKVELYNPIKDELYKIRNTLLSEKYNIPIDSLEVLQRDLNVNRIMLSVEANDSTTKEMIKLFSSAFTYIITVFIFSKIANEIASEKQSKSIEYILTTVSEKEYLLAKIFSNVVWLILQGLLLILYYFIAALIASITKMIDVDFSLTTSMVSGVISKDIVSYILVLIIYNVLNLILLCIIQATLASKTSSTSEAGNSVSLLLFVMMVAYISTVYFLRPYEKVKIVLYIISCIPILSAYFVPGMMVIGQATMPQIIVSLVLLILSIPITFHFCTSIFKNGILDYTKVKKKNGVIKSKDEMKRQFLNKREMKSFAFVIGIAIIIYVGTQTVFSFIGNIALSTLFDNILSETQISLIMQILLQVVSLGLASLFVFMYSSDNKVTIEKKNVSTKTKVKCVLITLFLIFVLQIVLSLLLYPLLGLDYDTTDLFKVDNSSDMMSKIILVFTLAITPGIFEELFFRKAIINFSVKYGKVFALLFSAILFGMLHMNVSQGLFAFIMGLILGAIYLYTGDITLTMLIHFLNNGFAALSLVLPEIGVIAITAIMLIVVIIGFILFVNLLAKKETREKLIHYAKTKISLKSFDERYKYVFTDFIFDVSLILIVLMSVITEKILR